MRFFSELKRRNVFRVGLLYIVAAWLIIQVAETVLPMFDVPDGVLRGLVIVLALGFVPAVIFAWVFEWTPDGIRPKGIKQRTAHKLNWATLIVGVLAIGLLVADRLLPEPAATRAPTPATENSIGDETVRTDEGPNPASIAVLPFADLSPEGDQQYFSDGIAEEILNVLSRIESLNVTSRTSAFAFRSQSALSIRDIAEELQVRHVLEGSVRKAADTIRITAQLIDAATDQHLWSDTYDRPVDDAFRVQTDIATQVASALGILLDERERNRMEAAGVRDPEAYALYARGFELYQLAHGGAPQIPTLVEANVFFEQAFARAPGLWAARYHSADLYTHILLELAAGVDPATLPAKEVARAREQHEQHLREALRAAPNAAARDFVEITRKSASDDWTGLGALVRRAMDHTEACSFDQWMHVAGPAFGMAEPARQFFLRAARCNALDESNWLHAAINSIYTGDAAQALEIAERGLEVANVTGFGLEEIRLESLLALGRFDEARAALSRLDGSINFNRAKGEAWIAAARGDRAALDDLRQRLMRPSNQAGIATSLHVAARTGDRGAANALAADIDARPSGPMYLMVGIYFCLCGAPFDFEVTPNLAARLDQAGLAWPPVESIRWPLKGW